MASNAGEMRLKIWFHPSMPMPVKIGAATFTMRPDLLVGNLMEDCEAYFARVAASAGVPFELQMSMLWNTKDPKQALNPYDRLDQHFVSGETFGVYGDVVPASENLIPKAEEDKVPVTILTGFLGSGKTTLLNYILQEQRERKIAVIENEFGEVSIDDALLTQEKLSTAEKIVLMDNGCMCCTIRGDLVKGLNQILDDIKHGGQIDAIMIETTGMADPVPIVRTFMSDPELTRDLRLDAVIAMADAKNLPGRLDDKVEKGKVNEAYQQVAFADKIILNKLDLITIEEAIAVKDRIRGINKYAKVLGAVRGRVKMEELVNIRAHDICNFVNEDIEKEAEVSPELTEGHGGHGGHGGPSGHSSHGGRGGHGEDCLEDHDHGSHGGHDGHGKGHATGHGSGHGSEAGHGFGHGHGDSERNRHDTRVNSFSICREGEIVPKRLHQWMQLLSCLSPERGTIFRVKAILAVKGRPVKHVFHAVMDISDMDEAGPWAPGETRTSKIVFIGKSMDEPFLREKFDSIFEKRSPACG